MKSHSRLYTLQLAGALLAPPVQAGDGSFGWVYTLDLQPKGTFEFEQRLQLNQNQATGTYQAWYSRTELEYGLTNDIQVSAYINSSKITAQGNYTNCDEGGPNPCTAGFGVNVPNGTNARYSKTRYDGASLEGIWRITNPITSPIGIGLYVEPTLGPTLNSLEGRILLQSNFLNDKLVLAANIAAETTTMKWQNANGEGPSLESELDVLLGASYKFAPHWSAGVEAKQHNGYTGAHMNQATQHAWFAGPTVGYSEKHWWVNASYRRQLNGAVCSNGGQVDCSNGYAWEEFTKNEYLVKFGIPF